MDRIDLSSRANGAPSPAGKPSKRTVVSVTVHVHATPAAAVAEMDARRRDWIEWLASARSHAGVAAAEGARPSLDLSNRGGRSPQPGDPDPSSHPEEMPPVDPMTAPRPAPDVVDPAAIPPGLPGGAPGGPPDVPRER